MPNIKNSIAFQSTVLYNGIEILTGVLSHRTERAREQAQAPKAKSPAKALHVPERFAVQEPELGITELAGWMQVTKSHVHNIVSTVRQLGLI